MDGNEEEEKNLTPDRIKEFLFSNLQKQILLKSIKQGYCLNKFKYLNNNHTFMPKEKDKLMHMHTYTDE